MADHLHQWFEDRGKWVCECGAVFGEKGITRTVSEALTPRQYAVWAKLGDHEWHDGPELTHPEVGGSEGLRRLRELREKGFVIEMRRKAKGRTTRQYRLVR